jgi:hypothetical protein
MVDKYICIHCAETLFVMSVVLAIHENANCPRTPDLYLDRELPPESTFYLSTQIEYCM